MIIYLDESGDLGWKFDKPYRSGGSSRHLTIASLVVSQNKKHLPKRLIKKLYTKFNWNSKNEKKWADMSHEQRVWFAQNAKELRDKNPDNIKYLFITVNKMNVQDHIRKDPNKLYNYMIGLSLLDEMKQHKNIILMPDNRSIKVESGNSLNDYLQTKLWFELNSNTKLETKFIDSAKTANIQFADMLSGLMQGYFEDNKTELFAKLSVSNNKYKKLFF